MTLFEGLLLLVIALIGLAGVLAGFAVVRRMPKNPDVIWAAIQELQSEFSNREAANAEYIERLEGISDQMERRRRALQSKENRENAKQGGAPSAMTEEDLLKEAQKRFGGVTNLG